MNKTRKPSIQPKASIFGQIINLTINVFPFFAYFCTKYPSGRKVKSYLLTLTNQAYAYL